MASLKVHDIAPIVNEEDDQDSREFIHFRASMRLPIAPCWAADGTQGGQLGQGGMEGVKEVLASWIMRYLPPLRAVLLSFDPSPSFAHPTERFPSRASPFSNSTANKDPSRLLHSDDDTQDDDDDASGQLKAQDKVKLKVLPMIAGSGFTLANVQFKGMAWRPQVGQRIVGSPTLSTPSHISLLLHNLFNASIPVSHIPQDEYYFDVDYPVPAIVQQRQQLEIVSTAVVAKDVAEQEQQAHPDATATGNNNEDAQEGDQDDDDDEEPEHEQEQKVQDLYDQVEQEEDQYRQHGWWLHKSTHLPLGGEDGRIEFTIVGITVANAMISLTGSLLQDPFDPTVAAPTTVSLASKANKEASKKRSRAADVLDPDQVVDPEADVSDSSRSPSPEPRSAPPSVKKDKKSKKVKKLDREESKVKKGKKSTKA